MGRREREGLRTSIRRFNSLQWRDKARVLESVATVVVANVGVSVLPFRWLVRGADRDGSGASVDVTATEAAKGLSVGHTVAAVSRRLPGQPACLVQGLAVQWALHWRRVPNSLHLGAMFDVGDNELSASIVAHAWVRVGHEIVVGKSGHRNFTEVAVFHR